MASMYTVSQQLDPFLFEHNFGKYCPRLIVLLLLQTEITYDLVYPTINHHTSNVLVHYLENEQECIGVGEHCWHDFVICL